MTDPSSVSVVVARLVERGLARRRSSAADARRIEVTLTPKGRATVEKAPEAAQAHLIAGLEALPTARLRALRAGLEAVVAAMGVAAEAPGLFFEDERKQRYLPRQSPGDGRRPGAAPVARAPRGREAARSPVARPRRGRR